MKVSGSSIALSQPLPDLRARRDTAAASANPNQARTNTTADSTSGRDNARQDQPFASTSTSGRADESLVRRPPALNSAANQLPFTVRSALALFAQNTPTVQQRLGIELAGIDTFV